MKKQKSSPLFFLGIAFLCLIFSVFAGRNLFRSASPVITPRAVINPAATVVDINRADQEALMTLPEIGHTLARRIVDYRNTHGPFTSLTELLNIEGIGEATLEALLPYITAGG